VEANYRGRGKFYPGKIKMDRRDGTYDIDYDDGESETRVKEGDINFLNGDKGSVKGDGILFADSLVPSTKPAASEKKSFGTPAVRPSGASRFRKPLSRDDGYMRKPMDDGGVVTKSKGGVALVI
jgi:hypothetical protein